MIVPFSNITSQSRLTLLNLLGLFWLLTTTPLWAAAFVSEKGNDFPSEYGEVVYRTDTNSPQRVFIIANSHRSPLSGVNGSETVQAQIETFRISEWLIRQQQVEILLPEGFFGSRDKSAPTVGAQPSLDTAILAQRLADTSVFVNAELLLHEAHGIKMQQVENRAIYLETRELLHAGLNGEALPRTFAHELGYLQRLRSATILQNIPTVLESAQQQGDLLSHSAILTIGLSHLNHIITFLEAGEVRISAPLTGGERFPAIHSQLESFKDSIDITVIVPRSLLEKPLVVHNGHSQTI